MTIQEMDSARFFAKSAVDSFAFSPTMISASRLVEAVGQFAYEVLTSEAGTALLRAARSSHLSLVNTIRDPYYMPEVWEIAFPDQRTASLEVPGSFDLWKGVRDLKELMPIGIGIEREDKERRTAELGRFLVILTAFSRHSDADGNNKSAALARGLVDFTQPNSGWADAHEAATWLARPITQAIDDLHAEWRPSKPPAFTPDRTSTVGEPTGPASNVSANKRRYFRDRAAVLAAGFHGESLRGTKTLLAMVVHPERKPRLGVLDEWAEKEKIALIRHAGHDYEMFFRTKPDFDYFKPLYDASKDEDPSQTSA